MNYEEMIKLAESASKNAYVPYSKFPVGACVLTDDGNIFTGCNFENSSFGMTICAERNAIGSAIAAGERKVKAIAIFSPNMYNCTPCGACRQVLLETENRYNRNIRILLYGENGTYEVQTVKDLLPLQFVKETMDE